MADKVFYANLTPEQVDELLQYLPPLTPERMAGIQARFDAATGTRFSRPAGSAHGTAASPRTAFKPRRRALRWIAACAALLLLSTSIALAATHTIDLEEIFNSFFSDKVKIDARLSDPVTVNGVEMRLQSVYTDGRETYAKVRVRDREGKRLTEWVEAELAGTEGYAASVQMRNRSPAKPTNQTVLDVAIRFSEAFPKDQPVAFTIRRLGMGIETVRNEPLDFDLAPYLAERPSISYAEFKRRAGVNEGDPWICRSYENVELEEQAYLTQDAFLVEIPGVYWAKISNIGLIDGRLHIQYRKTDAFNEKFHSGYLGLLDADGTPITSYFDMDMGPFRESVFDIGDREAKDLTLSISDGARVQSAIEGPWTLSYTPAEVAAAREIAITPENLPQYSRMEVTTTAMNTRIRAYFSGEGYDAAAEPTGPEPEATYFMENANPVLVLKGGERVVLQLGPEFPSSPAGQCCFIYSSSHFDIEDLQSIRIFGTEYPFE